MKELISEIKQKISNLREIDEAEAIGVCGSLARGRFNKRSDIDLFVVIKERKPGIDYERLWYDRLYNILSDLKRDITVIVYSLAGLKKIVTWYVLRLASEGILLYDKGNVKGLFERIIKTAKEAGLVEREISGYKVWSAPSLKLGEELILEVKDEEFL
jgi:predicted nucleotidyltransferase